MTWWVWLLAVLAATRTFRLLAIDEITEPLRKQVDKGPAWLQLMMLCPWCIGFYISAAWVWTGYLYGTTAVWLILAGSLAVNYIQANLSVHLDMGE